MFAAMVTEPPKIRVAILMPSYEGHVNEGMRCIREILNQHRESNNIDLEWDEFDVRRSNQVPDMSYDLFISSGGPGDPLESRYSDWEKVYFTWLKNVERWNENPANLQKRSLCFLFAIHFNWHAVTIILGL